MAIVVTVGDISVSELFGNFSTVLYVNPNSISVSELLGNPNTITEIDLGGIGVSELLGLPSTVVYINFDALYGIVSYEQLGEPVSILTNINRNLTSICVQEYLGSPVYVGPPILTGGVSLQRIWDTGFGYWVYYITDEPTVSPFTTSPMFTGTLLAPTHVIIDFITLGLLTPPSTLPPVAALAGILDGNTIIAGNLTKIVPTALDGQVDGDADMTGALAGLPTISILVPDIIGDTTTSGDLFYILLDQIIVSSFVTGFFPNAFPIGNVDVMGDITLSAIVDGDADVTGNLTLV